MVGVFDDIRTPTMPIDHPPFFVCVQLEFEKNETGREHEMTIIMIDEDGKQNFRMDGRYNLPNEPGILRPRLFLMIQIAGVRIEAAGTYRLDVLVNGQIIGTEYMPVHHIVQAS